MTVRSTPGDNLETTTSPGNRPMPDAAPEPVILSIVIATYNARQLLADCLTSIYANPPSEPYEIIVVDDASVDDTSEMVQVHFPEVRLLRNPVNVHYATSNNRAFKIARGEYVYLLNNDTIVLPEALDRMLDFLRTHSDAGAVGNKLLNEDGSIQWSVKSLPNPGSALFGARSYITRLFPNNRFSRKHLMHLGRNPEDTFIAGYVSSASTMLPRHVIEKVGDLDWRLSYHVDADYCKRIADAGYHSYYLPTATIIHLDHRGGTMVNFKRRFRSVVEFHRGSYIFYCKHLRRTTGPAMRVIIPSALLCRFVLALGLQMLAEGGRFATALLSKPETNTPERADR